MDKVYVSGPLTNVKEIHFYKAFYEKLGRTLLELGLNPYIPHMSSDPILHKNLSPKEVYDLDHSNVIAADLVIAYVGIPSIGVGQEVEIARTHNIPVLLLYEQGKSVSRMTRGSPNVIAEISFEDFDEALYQVRDFLRGGLKTGTPLFYSC